MSVTIELSAETTARLRTQAAMVGLGLDVYVAQLVERSSEGSPLDRALRTLMERTPDERTALRTAILAASRPAKPLLEGKTLEELVVGTWPGDESDAVVDAALKELS
ncbi:MAG: hypothetical protein NTX57_03495 [Armatimonadetes bacterium]|jgi:hypothetical protein|nr:hypothetical protein [Armatimonadota bacterium]